MCGDFVAPVLVARLVEPISGSACFAMTCFTEDEYIRQSHLTFCAKTYYPWQQRHHFLQKISQDWSVCGQTSVDRVYYMVDWCLVLGSPWSHHGVIEQLQVMFHLRLLKRIASEASFLLKMVFISLRIIVTPPFSSQKSFPWLLVSEAWSSPATWSWWPWSARRGSSRGPRGREGRRPARQDRDIARGWDRSRWSWGDRGCRTWSAAPTSRKKI